MNGTVSGCREVPAPGSARRRAALWLVIILLLSLCGPSAASGEIPADLVVDALDTADVTIARGIPRHTSADRGLRPGDQLWIINTRRLPRPSGGDAFTPDVYAFDPQFGWSNRDLSDVSRPFKGMAVIYVHGNRVSSAEAERRGWRLYHSLRAFGGEEPLRIIIWSWPSDQIRGQLRDVRFKAELADEEGYYLATWLAESAAGEKRGIIGYSYGARVIGSSLHFLGGGDLPGTPPIATLPAADVRLRVVLLAAAMDSFAFAEGEAFDDAFCESLDRLTIFYNPCDPILRGYRWLDRCRMPEALGCVGPTGFTTPPATIQLYDVSHTIGKSHDLFAYLCHPWMIARIYESLAFSPANHPVSGSAFSE